MHEQMTSLLTAEEQQESGTATAFAPFSNLGLQHNTSFTAPLWRAAMAKYERLMEPVQLRVGHKLRASLSDLQSNAQSLQGEFRKYRELLARPAIAHSLVRERQILLSQLQEEFAHIHDSYNQLLGDGSKRQGGTSAIVWLFKNHRYGNRKRGGEKGGRQTNGEAWINNGALPSQGREPGRNVSQLILALTWARQISSRLSDVGATVQTLLSDLPGADGLQSQADEVGVRENGEAHEYSFGLWAALFFHHARPSISSPRTHHMP